MCILHLHVFQLKNILIVQVILTFLLMCVKSESIPNQIRMVRKQHYPFERHWVKTKDGYILSLYRIPQMNIDEPRNRKVVLFMHGMTSSAPAYFTFKRSAGYTFFDAGYDVWIGNSRGNTYSRKHVTLDPNNSEFWDFSWHEIGIYDLPATIDYILSETNQTKLAYVGHSQGATALLVTLSELPQYNSKISILHAMTPPVIFKYNHPWYPTSMEGLNVIGNWLRQNNMCELAARKHLDLLRAAADLCMTPSGSELCKSFIFNLFGPSNQYYDRLTPDIINHVPAGASYKQFIHYGQITISGKFHNFHHGTKKNMQLYGSPNPPEYNVTKIRTKIHILYGSNDRLIPQSNIPYLVEKLKPNVVAISKLDGFNHIDFTYAKNLHLVHKKIFRILKRYH